MSGCVVVPGSVSSIEKRKRIAAAHAPAPPDPALAGDPLHVPLATVFPLQK